jgi:hypothetical protein
VHEKGPQQGHVADPLEEISYTFGTHTAVVTAQNIDAGIPDLESALRQAGMAVQGTPQKITVAGLPGLRLRVTEAGGASTRVFAFNGTTEYVVACEYTAGTAAQVGRACNQVTGSFRVSGAASGAAAPATSPPARAAP